MKVVILAGGAGTRISEETDLRPKPMIEIGGKPILWHIMKSYSNFGFNDFVICLGYKGEIIKKYFADYHLHMSDITFNLRENTMVRHNNYTEAWNVTLVDTGLSTLTGGRLKRLGKYLKDEQTFLMTYGDGVADVDLPALVRYHEAHGRLATLTAVTPTERFGVLGIDSKGVVTSFREKQRYADVQINGGYFALSPKVLDYIADDATSFEQEPLERLSSEGNLMAFKHHGFWQCMDTLRDKNLLEDLWKKGAAPWKTWS
ncbi:MAG TPA: glucose-1-phosphate cytidylyltransferase [bacterium]|jgi:glucose-1-phosphate cytidylyltransferase|nr:glucose-1-phosphate cytidylyltransferase [bacterium]